MQRNAVEKNDLKNKEIKSFYIYFSRKTLQRAVNCNKLNKVNMFDVTTLFPP